jgi:hemerythrin-like domain-containing protein
MSTPDLGMFLLAHRALRRDADAVADAARRLDPESVTGATALLDAFGIAESMLHHHHVAEDDLVWPAIVARRPSCAEALAELEAEHDVVERWLGEIRLALETLSSPDAVDRAAVTVDLVVAASSLATSLRAHLEHEERVAVPMIVEVLTGAEWDELDVRRKAGMAPEVMAMSLPWILSVVPEEERGAVAAAKLPAEVVALWRSQWAPAYEQRVVALAA